MNKFSIPGLMLCLGTFIPFCQAEVQKPADWLKNPNKDTIFELHADTQAKALIKETKANRGITSSGLELIKDDDFGTCLHFGENGDSRLSVKSNAKDSYEGGVTFETWIYLEKPLPKPKKSTENVGLIYKRGAFGFGFNEGKLHQSGFLFNSEKIPTDRAGQYDYYPMTGHGGTARTVVPSGKWVHIAMTYDENSKMFRYWIDGKLDSERQFNKEEKLSIPGGEGDYSLFGRMQNCRVAGVRLLKGVYNPGTPPPLKVLINQYPWQDKVLVSLDRIDAHLNFPLQAEVFLKSSKGTEKKVAQGDLSSTAVKHLEFNMNEGERNQRNTCTIKVSSRSGEVFSESTELALTKPSGDWVIHPDKSISVKGKKIFPRMIYMVLPEDFKEVKSLGFNIVHIRSAATPWNQILKKDDPETAKILETARKEDVFFMPAGKENKKPPFTHIQSVQATKDSQNLFGFYSFDEPYAFLLDEVPSSYNGVKLVDPNHPIVICQNNLDRAKETCVGCDVILPDPYAFPDVSFRLVSDMTESARRGSFDTKPVWTVLDAYPQKLPDKESLRCMVYLALCSGANGIAIFDWDERLAKDMSDERSPKYLKNHPVTFNAVKDAIAELASLEDILVNPNQEGAVSFEPKKNCLHAAIKISNGKMYLFVASDSRQAEEGTIVIKGISSAIAKPLPVCGFPDSLKFENGKAQVQLPKLAAAVFELVGK